MNNKNKMISIIILFSAFMMFVSCGQTNDKVEKIMEDGVEVVVNHIEPYKIKGEPTTFNIEKEFSIDLEREDLAEKGLSDAVTFDIDSEGNIYFARSWEKENCIFKFDSSGNFVTSFVRRGQGPGEIQFIRYFGIDSKDNIIISDHVSKKVFIFNKEGAVVKETRYPPVIQAICPLENGKYLAYWRYTKGGDVDPTADFFQFGFTLISARRLK
jgi:hypothetical protein